MQTYRVDENQTSLPHYRVIRGFDGVVRVDIWKAREAMKYAMSVRKNSKNKRASDLNRDKLVGPHVQQ